MFLPLLALRYEADTQQNLLFLFLMFVLSQPTAHPATAGPEPAEHCYRHRPGSPRQGPAEGEVIDHASNNVRQAHHVCWDHTPIT